MSIPTYSSRNEDSLLKSLGPHRITITAQGIKNSEPETTVVSIPKIFGVLETYGEVIA